MYEFGCNETETSVVHDGEGVMDEEYNKHGEEVKHSQDQKTIRIQKPQLIWCSR